MPFLPQPCIFQALGTVSEYATLHILTPGGRGRTVSDDDKAERSQMAESLKVNQSSKFVCSTGKGKGLDTCYSAAYTSQTRNRQRFTILEVAADWHWHEPVVPQHIMCPSIARANRQLDPRRCSQQTHDRSNQPL